MHGYRRGKRTHVQNKEEVVVITITAPEKSTQSSIAIGCVPGALRVVLYKFGQIDMACTLVQVI